jgi:L-asparaginase II
LNHRVGEGGSVLPVKPIRVEVVRGGVVEAVHTVHAVAVVDGRVALAAGDADRVTFLRSAAKPIQALPVVRSCPELDDEQIVLCCASHLHRPEQVAIVRRTLAAAGATPDDLECGPEPTRLEHTCSGKHAGFLCLCRARGWSHEGYRLAGHPCQDAMLDEVAAATGLSAGAIATAVDGCGVVTFGVSLHAAAASFVRLRALEGADRVVAAIAAHAELLSGPVEADALVNTTLPGWVAKGGAEGLLCASSPDGLGVALKVEDGSYRALLPALGRVLGPLGIKTSFGDDALPNSRGEPVGVLRVA